MNFKKLRGMLFDFNKKKFNKILMKRRFLKIVCYFLLRDYTSCGSTGIIKLLINDGIL